MKRYQATLRITKNLLMISEINDENFYGYAQTCGISIVNELKLPQYFACHWFDQGPLVLAWINFSPSIDK